MIHIKEIFSNSKSVAIKVDGILNADSLSTLQAVIQRNLKTKRNIRLHLDGIMHVDREGADFLRKHRRQIALEGLSEFLKLELDLSN